MAWTFRGAGRRAGSILVTIAATIALVGILQLGGCEPSNCNGAPSGSTESNGTCCKVCTQGKACGDSCIARNKTCKQPPGCACNR